MIDPEGTGSPEDEGFEEDIALPSWIDAAIAKSRGARAPDPGYESAQPPLEPHEEAPALGIESGAGDFEPLHGNDWLAEHDHSMAAEATTEEVGELENSPEIAAHQGGEFERAVFELPVPQRPSDNMPSFLSRSNLAPAMPVDVPEGLEEEDDLLGDSWTEFQDEDSSVFVQHERPATIPMPETIPIPEAPPRRRGIMGPWLMAAIFFAAAALVMAVLIWLKPLPR